MAYTTNRFEDYEVSKGLAPNKSNFSPHFVQSQNSTNLTSGIQQGIAPRYGMSPIPGQSHTDSPTNAPTGLMQSESNGGSNRFINRTKVMGLIPVTLGSYADVTQKKISYCWLVVDSSNYLSFVFNSNFGSGAFQHINDIAAGIQPSDMALYSSPASFLDPVVLRFPLRSSTSLTDLQNFLQVNPNLFYSSFTSLTVSGKDVPMHWAGGRAVTVGDANTTALPNFVKPDPLASNNHYMGIPSFFNTRNFKDSVRQMTFYNMDISGALIREYQYSVSPSSSVFSASFNQDNSAPNITSGIGAGTGSPRLDGGAPVYADVKTVLYNDSQSVCNSGYTALFAAPGKAVMAVVQDWQRNHEGTLPQYVDPTNPVLTPIARQTVTSGSSAFYKEINIAKATCWTVWPSYDGATPLPANAVSAYDGITHVTLGAASSGVLRSNTSYEFSFSIYDKQFDTESNVGLPARILTGANDFVRISLFRDSQTAAIFNQGNGFTYQSNVVFPTSFNSQASPSNTPLNYLEYRVYYRQLGSYEWLPALFVDAAKFWYYPNHGVLWACEGAIAALPGGQPGAFNDYSPLAKDVYNDVKIFQNRVFWLSPQNLTFSLRRNGFSYPLRNSVPCPNGEFRGMIVHYFFGQAQQGGRIVVFGSKETYSGTFTGNQVLSPIQISPNTLANYPLDGSDFVLDTRTSITAFSSRGAIVAEGDLFFWGPTGVYYDNGVNVPEKISGGLEPDILSVYDPNKTDEVFAQYVEETKEIIWFYTKKNSTTGNTSGLVYNTVTEQFFNVDFEGKIDWSSKAPIDKTNVNRDTNGTRNIAGVRQASNSAIQRAVFFDYRNRAGDFLPTTETLIKQVALNANGSYRFYLAGGYQASALTNVTGASKICIQQGQDYSANAQVKDCIGQVLAKGGTFPNQYLDIVLPTEFATYFTGSLTTDRYFPLYVSDVHGIPYVLESNFWCPAGIASWWQWMFLHLLFKLTKLPSDNLIPPNQGKQTLELAYRTPISKDYVINELTLTDNAKGNFQVYSQLKYDNQAAEGQGLQIRISGVHFGSEWVLQYIGIDGLPKDKDCLQTYEG